MPSYSMVASPGSMDGCVGSDNSLRQQGDGIFYAFLFDDYKLWSKRKRSLWTATDVPRAIASRYNPHHPYHRYGEYHRHKKIHRQLPPDTIKECRHDCRHSNSKRCCRCRHASPVMVPMYFGNDSMPTPKMMCDCCQDAQTSDVNEALSRQQAQRKRKSMARQERPHSSKSPRDRRLWKKRQGLPHLQNPFCDELLWRDDAFHFPWTPRQGHGRHAPHLGSNIATVPMIPSHGPDHCTMDAKDDWPSLDVNRPNEGVYEEESWVQYSSDFDDSDDLTTIWESVQIEEEFKELSIQETHSSAASPDSDAMPSLEKWEVVSATSQDRNIPYDWTTKDKEDKVSKQSTMKSFREALLAKSTNKAPPRAPSVLFPSSKSDIGRSSQATKEEATAVDSDMINDFCFDEVPRKLFKRGGSHCHWHDRCCRGKRRGQRQCHNRVYDSPMRQRRHQQHRRARIHLREECRAGLIS